jgi:hypothetical protein
MLEDGDELFHRAGVEGFFGEGFLEEVKLSVELVAESLSVDWAECLLEE